MLLISCISRRKGTLTHWEAKLVAGLPSFPNPPSTWPRPSPWASLGLRTRAAPPHASVLPAPLVESSFPRAPSEQAPLRASPREREPAPPPLVTARTPKRRGRASSPRERADGQKRPRLCTRLARCPPRRAAPLPWSPRERVPPSRCTADGASSGWTAGSASLRGLGFAFEWGTNQWTRSSRETTAN
jgi:hypothetical protein